jgi:hypothetical protein
LEAAWPIIVDEVRVVCDIIRIPDDTSADLRCGVRETGQPEPAAKFRPHSE